jgi:Flp pilus assembly protein TadD
LRDYEKARLDYEMAVKLQPDNKAAQYGLAMACAKLGLEDQHQRAMEQYEKLDAADMQAQRSRRGAVYDAPKYRSILAMTCCDAAGVYARGGMSRMAERLLCRAAEVDPEDIACRVHLAQLLCAKNRAAEAVPFAKELIEIEPNNAIFHLTLAEVYDRLQRFDEAREAVRKAVELAPDDEKCRNFQKQLQTKR